MNRLFFILLIASNICLINCDTCLSGCDTGPFYGILFIKLTENDENPQIPIEIYEGNFDDGILILQDTVPISEIDKDQVFYELEAGFYYTVAVQYQQGAKTIIAIDRAELALESDDCDCSYPTDRTLNLRLAK